jgi:adenylate kinase family enzyme
MPVRLHIFGAPGAGTTTLGRNLAQLWDIPHLDTDDFHWFTDDPLPYRRRRNPEHRRQLLAAVLDGHEHWVLSGALCGWGDPFIPRFDAVIWLWLPTPIRLERIRNREAARYGSARIDPGGDLHQVYQSFLRWAADYDDASGRIRSRAAEEAWLEGLPCPVTRMCYAPHISDRKNSY